MKNQYCKIGAVTPIALNRSSVHLLQYQYENFLDRAAKSDAQLKDYFELKAQKLNKILENLV